MRFNPVVGVPGKYEDSAFLRGGVLRSETNACTAGCNSVENQEQPHREMFGNCSLVHPRNAHLEIIAALVPRSLFLFRMYLVIFVELHTL